MFSFCAKNADYGSINTLRSSVDEFALKPKGSGKGKCTETNFSSNPNQSGAKHVGNIMFFFCAVDDNVGYCIWEKKYTARAINDGQWVVDVEKIYLRSRSKQYIYLLYRRIRNIFVQFTIGRKSVWFSECVIWLMLYMLLGPKNLVERGF